MANKQISGDVTVTPPSQVTGVNAQTMIGILMSCLLSCTHSNHTARLGPTDPLKECKTVICGSVETTGHFLPLSAL